MHLPQCELVIFFSLLYKFDINNLVSFFQLYAKTTLVTKHSTLKLIVVYDETMNTLPVPIHEMEGKYGIY